ncbi:MAG: T9SS type A sorting domain-containing protein, partial [Ignavibacteriales bacterium]|nr:T9SS type A sorting domain-containing protein [Ignavibacteriales bacterium]
VNASTIDGFLFDGKGIPADAGIKVTNGSVVSHNIVRGVTRSFAAGIQVDGGAKVVNNTIVKCSYAIEFRTTGVGAPVVKNNIVAFNSWGMVQNAYPASVRPYNCVYQNSFNYTGFDTNPGTGDISLNPQFRDTANVDFRLGATSACLNVGDPADPVGNEPEPNGGRIDMGAYGGTNQAGGPSLSGPTATTGNATLVTSASAALNGTVNPNGTNALAWFEYGTSNTLATPLSTQKKTVLAATTNVSFSDGVSGLLPGTTYYFRIAAQNSTDSSRGSIASFVTTPTAPTLVTPANGATNQSTTVTLSWIAPTGATSYRLQVATGSSFASPVFDDSTITTTSRQVSSLANNTLYYWRVRAKNTSGSGNYSSSFTFTTVATTPTAPESPTLSSPANGAANQSTTLTLSWTATTGASTYRLQVSTALSFTSFVFDDSTITTASKQIGPLANNASYYWRVQAKNAGGSSLYSSPSAFTTVATAIVSMPSPLSFPATPTSSADYRLVSIPGVINSLTVGDILIGSQKTDWRVYQDNGASANFLTELASSSSLKAGEGYWLLKKGPFTVSRSVTMPSISSDGTYGIVLHTGWNIIGNPFDRSVPWALVRSANGLSAALQPLAYNGTYASSTSLEPFAGYYFDNRTAGLAQLKIPFPFPSSKVSEEKPPPVDWLLQLVFESDINADRENYIGIAPSTSPDRDELDSREPPLFLDQGFLYFDRPEWDEEYRRFAGDFRPSLGEGQVWDFEVSNPRLSKAKITVRGMENISPEFGVTLLSLSNTIPIDLRTTNEYTYQTVSERMQFKLIVGKRSYVQGEVEKLVPESFALEQNYPNPFNPTTSITFTLPREAGVQVEVFSTVGQHIRTITDRAYPAGIHTLLWDGVSEQGEKVASGMYFYRLVADGAVVKVRKMIVLK